MWGFVPGLPRGALSAANLLMSRYGPRQDWAMVTNVGAVRDFDSAHETALLTATGRNQLLDAMHWIAEGRRLNGEVDGATLLGALVAAADAGVAGAEPALRTAVRAALRSTLDTSADLVMTDGIVPPSRYEAALANVARRTASGTLVDITGSVVMAAQADDPLVIEALGLVAGLSWRDLQARAHARGTSLPGEADGSWSPSQVFAAFSVVDDVVCGRVEPQVPGAVAARPIELLLGGTASGWAAVESMREGGVSYGTLLAQRDVGSAWSAHRNRSNNEISRLMVRRVLNALDEAGVGYWSTEGDAAVAKTVLGQRAGASGKPPGQLSIVTRAATGGPGYAVLIAIARDGGTARKTAATLLQLPKRFNVPSVLVLFGTGWADRGESDDLVRAFGGRLYTEHTLEQLAEAASTVGTS